MSLAGSTRYLMWVTAGHADVAMYEAKKLGSSVATYAARGDQHSPQWLHLLTDLRDALVSTGDSQLAMHYQPQVSPLTGELHAVEALLRWRHPRHGYVPTADLLDVAEHSPVMQQLTARVIDDVLGQVAAWRPLIQGWITAHPMPPDELAGWLAGRRQHAYA